MELLWEDFFRDPSQFWDIRNRKKSDKSPDFRHKQSGQALWIDGWHNPHWVRVKLQKTELPCFEAENDSSSIIGRIKSCGKFKDILRMKRIQAENEWIAQDMYIATTLIHTYAKCGALKEAQDAFDQLERKTVGSWNALISGYANQGIGEEALRCLREMVESGFIPDGVTYICSLKACAAVGCLQTVEKIHSKLREKELLKNSIALGNALVNAYAKCNALREARLVFDELPERDVVSWSCLIAAYVDHGLGEEALTCFKEMENDGLIPNEVTYISTLKACGLTASLDLVEEIHDQIRDRGLLKNKTELGNTLVNAYAKCGAVQQAQRVFRQLPVQDIVSWNALIHGYTDQSFGKDALACFMEMKEARVIPNAVTYISVLKACSFERSLQIVEEIHSQVRQKGLLENNTHLGIALVNAYAKCGALKEAQKVFVKIGERNVAAWNVLMSGFVDHGYGDKALKCFREMENNGVLPDSVSYVCILKGCAIARYVEFVEGILTELIKRGLLETNNVLVNSLVHAYAKCGAFEEAQKLFDQLPQQNVASWNALISGYADQGLGLEALECYREMLNNGILSDSVTYTCSLKACAIVGSLQTVEEIHVQLREQELLKEDIVLANALINAYAKCGAVNKANEVFHQLGEHNIESWNALLTGYAQSGQVNGMLDCFSKMTAEGFIPNAISFLALLNGCSHGDLLEEGQRQFDLIGTYGLSPTPEHYSCMVDLFGRSGRLEKAKCLVLNDTSTLLAFLSACQKWVNFSDGRWVFEKLLQLDAKSSSVYLCTANIYAACGVIQEAEEMELLTVKESV